EPVVVRAPRWITTTWSIDERFELAMGFDGELTRCGASVTLPNGVRTGSLFGRRIISTRHRSAVVGALGRVCNFIRLLGEGAPQRGEREVVGGGARSRQPDVRRWVSSTGACSGRWSRLVAGASPAVLRGGRVPVARE